MFICGCGSFGHQEESPCKTPQKWKKSPNFCKIIGKGQGNKNLYSNQGLDTFNALLADLEDKKHKIYTQMGPDCISLVRFVYTNDSKHVKPIIVKVKEKNTQNMNSPRDTTMSPTGITKTVNVTRDVTQLYSKELEDLLSPVHGEETRDKNGTRKIMRCNNGSGSLKLHDLRQPRYYFTMVIVLVVLFLTIFERSFAIFCTSILWYLIPMMGESSSSSGSKLEILKKEHVTDENEKKTSEKQRAIFSNKCAHKANEP